jgi:hypothetical protein
VQQQRSPADSTQRAAANRSETCARNPTAPQPAAPRSPRSPRSACRAAVPRKPCSAVQRDGDQPNGRETAPTAAS